MIPSLAYGADGTIQNALSPYQPPQLEQEIVSLALLDIQQGDQILQRPFDEFNNMSLIERANLDQRDWLAWSEAPSTNPDEAWMFTGTSASTRNKIVSTAAHLTKNVPYGKAFAQNDEDEEDIAAGQVMDNALEYNFRRNNFQQTFLYGVIAGLVNPVAYFMPDYVKSYQEILVGTASQYKRRKVLDEMLSGFRHSLLPLDEVLFSSPYVFDFNRQDFQIHRRRVSYNDVKSRHNGHPNFVHVRVGVALVLNSTDSLFYDVNDIGDGMVEEARLMYKGRDLEFTMVNNIYLGNPNTDYNPFKHRRIQKDGETVPVYNIIKYGAEPIDAQRFFGFKSLAAKLSNDKELADRSWQNAVDASTFATFPSIFTMGAGKLDKSVFIPATTTEIGKDAKVDVASNFMNPQFAINIAKEAEQKMAETSLDAQFSGVGGGGDKTARESILLQQNAITNLGVIGTMIAIGMVKPISELMADDILRFQSVGETMQLAGGALGMKYMTMILNDKVIDGSKKSVVIRFTDRWAGAEPSDEEKLFKSGELLEEGGDERKIYEVNPAVWVRRRFLFEIEPDALMPKNDAFEKSLKLELYDRAINNPLIANDPEKLADVTRDFLFEPTVKGESAKYIPKDTSKVLQGIIPQSGNPPTGVSKKVVERGALSELTV